MGTNIKKNTVFLPKVCHMQLNYAFLLFWSILGEIHRELLFLVKKLIISERSTEIHRKFVFLNMFEKRVNPEKNLDLFKQLFLIKQVKGEQILTKTCFSPQSEPHTAKLCFSVVLKHFRGNWQRTSLFSQIIDFLRKEHWNTQWVYFS